MVLFAMIVIWRQKVWKFRRPQMEHYNSGQLSPRTCSSTSVTKWIRRGQSAHLTHQGQNSRVRDRKAGKAGKEDRKRGRSWQGMGKCAEADCCSPALIVAGAGSRTSSVAVF
eukprot:365125-Chlamydomonas_euryale.AAC.11